MSEAWGWRPLEPVSEILEWRTDVAIAPGAEDRHARRPVPREVLVMRHRVDAAGYAQMLAAIRANLLGDWTVSVWPRGTAEDSIPTRTGQMIEGPQIARARQGRSIVSVAFLLAPTASESAAPYPTYAGRDVLTDASLVREPMSERLTRPAEYVDSGVGPVAIVENSDTVSHMQSVSLSAHGLGERATLRSWLYTLRGRQKTFWLPTWGAELALQSPVQPTDTTITVGAVGGAAAAVGRHIMFDLPTPVFREITAATQGAGTLDLTIAAPGVPVPQATQVHWLSLARLDTDRIELTHTSTRTDVSLPVMEVPN